MVNPDALPTSSADWPVYRIIPTSYPKIDLFERLASPDQWEILYAIEALTNPRIRQEVGEISLVPAEDRVSGPGSSWIMAAFTHPPARRQGGRFNKDFGVYYCAPGEATAIAETSHHRAKFLRDSRIDSLTFEMRVLRAYLGPTHLHDVRNLEKTEIYHPDDYSGSQRLGAEMRAKNSPGIYYRSVRCDGECVAVFRPIVLSNAIHLKYLRYTYQEGAIVDVAPFDKASGASS